MIPVNPFNLKEINRKKLATPSPLRVFFVKGGVGGGGANAAFVMRLLVGYGKSCGNEVGLV